MSRPLDANWLTVSDEFAIPIRSETCRLMKGREPHDNEKAKANEKKRQ
jgi:hypothetical protein